MIRLLDRYVTGYFLRLFFLFAVAAPLLFVLFDVTDNLDRHLRRGATLDEVALSYVYQFPQFVLWALPVAALIATIFTVNGMTRHSEVAAAKAGGVSFFRLYAPIPAMGLLITIGGLALAEVVPSTIRLQAEVLGLKSRLRGTRTNFLFPTEDGRVFVIQRLDLEEGRIMQPALELEGDGELVPNMTATANQAVYRPDEGWVLQDGRVWLDWADGTQRSFQFSSMRPAGLDQSPEDLLVSQKEPDEMRYAELGRLISTVERAGGQARKLRVDQAQKIAIPIATFIIVLFAMPLATTTPRGGTAYGVGISLGITILYLLLFRLTGALGAGGTISPIAAAWIPNGIFLVAGLALMTRVRT